MKDPADVLFDDVLFDEPVLNVATPERLTPRTVVWKVPLLEKNVPLLNGLPLPPPKALARGAVRMGANKAIAKKGSPDLMRTEDVFI